MIKSGSSSRVAYRYLPCLVAASCLVNFWLIFWKSDGASLRFERSGNFASRQKPKVSRDPKRGA